MFTAVQSDSVAYGVVPFENSSNGCVVFTLDLFADIHNKHPDIVVEGEIYLAVHHCLVGHPEPTDSDRLQASKFDLPWRSVTNNKKEPAEAVTTPTHSGQCTPTQNTPSPQKPRVKPSLDISHITKLYSHPQAWGQCKAFLNTYLKSIERQDSSSTSKAAQNVIKEPTSAAISSKIAAQLNNLQVLAEGIEDNAGNSTRFLIIRHTRHTSLPSIPAADEDAEMLRYKTLVSFTVDHGEAGALADALAVFKRYSLNVTSINTRPSGEAAWHYIFFVEIQGRKRGQGTKGRVNEALGELEGVVKRARWLGSWQNQLG